MYVPEYVVPATKPLEGAGVTALVQDPWLQLMLGRISTVLVHDRLSLVQTPVSMPQLPGEPVTGYVTVTLCPAVKLACPLEKLVPPVGVPTANVPSVDNPDNTKSDAAKEMTTVENVLLVMVTEKFKPNTAELAWYIPELNPALVQLAKTEEVELAPPKLCQLGERLEPLLTRNPTGLQSVQYTINP